MSGATGTSYTPVTNDIGKTVTVRVTGTLTGYTTMTATATTAAVSGSAVVTVAPSITGAPVVDGELTADPGQWNPSDTTFNYQWNVAGVPVGGATGTTYSPRAGDVGSNVTVTVTGARSGSIPVSVNSAAMGPVIKADITAGSPSIAGTAQVGHTLTAAAGTWAPADVTLSYQWKANGVAVGTDSSTYALTGTDAGKTIAVKVTGSKAGYNGDFATSLGVTVLAGDITAGSPSIAGTAQVGHTLTAAAGTWAPADVTLSYQWKANGVAVGTDSSTYALTGTDAGKTIAVKVTGSKAGYNDKSATSTGVTVLAGDMTAGAVTISGVARAGNTLTANTTAWTPSSVALTYQWLANGSPVTGETDATYHLFTDDAGKKISVTVTGTLTGYTSGSATSAQTDAVITDVVTVNRLSGATRYDTAAAIAAKFATATKVYIATGEGYADALSAGPAAAHFDAPLLLTRAGVLPDVVKAQLMRLRPAQIVIVGGVGVVSAAVEAQLKGLSFSPEVRRVSGSDRYATSRALATDTWAAGSLGSAYLATGTNFPDALSAGPAAAHFDGPVILVPGMASTIDAATRALLTRLGVDKIKIAGGTGVISAAMEAQAKTIVGATNVTRNGAGNRYSTSVAINLDAFVSASTVYLATGSGYADALAGSALAGANGAPLFVTQTSCIPVTTLNAIQALGATNVVLLGGAGVLTAGVENLTSCG